MLRRALLSHGDECLTARSLKSDAADSQYPPETPTTLLPFHTARPPSRRATSDWTATWRSGLAAPSWTTTPASSATCWWSASRARRCTRRARMLVDGGEGLRGKGAPVRGAGRGPGETRAGGAFASRAALHHSLPIQHHPATITAPITSIITSITHTHATFRSQRRSTRRAAATASARASSRGSRRRGGGRTSYRSAAPTRW